MLRRRPRERRRMTRGHRGSLLLRCRALSSPSPCRFIPAHPQFPPPPSERSTPHTPGGSSGLHSRLSTPSLAFALTTRARLPLALPAGRRIDDAAGFALMLQTAQLLPLQGPSTLGFDPARYQTEP